MRAYIQPSWRDAAEDHDSWSGGNGQYRGDPSVDLSTFDKNGRARVEAFSDEAIESLKESRKKIIPVADKILPQRKRVLTLTTQMQDLVADYKAGNMSIEEYSMLLSVVSVKRRRAEELLAKAISIKAPFEDEESKPTATKTAARKANKVSEVSQVEDSKSLLNKALAIVKSDGVYFVCGAMVFVTAMKLFF